MTTDLYLLHLNKSSLRKRLLSYFFTNPDTAHYVREIANLINVDPTNLSRELRRFEKEGVFRAEKRGNQKVFSLNKKYPLYEELRSIVFKTIGVKAGIESLVKSTAGIQRAFLYGSFAKNVENASSDIDLCLVVGAGFKEDLFLSPLRKLEKQLGREISYVYFSEDEWKSKQRAKDSFITNLLKEKRIELIHEEN